MAGETLSAKNGTLYWNGSEEATITDITIEESVDLDEFGHNQSSGAADHVVGMTHWNATFTMKATPTFSKGQQATLVAYTQQDTASGTATIERISQRIPIDGGPAVEWQITARGKLALTRSTGSAP